MHEDDLAIPPRARLVHIGPHKTGTTSIQGSLNEARPKLPAHGVVYPGTERSHNRAGIYIAGGTGRIGDRPTSIADWKELAGQTAAAGNKRVVISSEWLCECSEDAVRRVIDELGGDRVHIVATLRPLAKILPSSWQQFLQNGLRADFEAWLRGMLLKRPYDRPTPGFWARHRHDEILEQWAKIAGPDHVTAIVVDARDHNKIFRQFESLLALPEGILVPEPAAKDNRSLTWPEAELLRQVNVAFKRQKWPSELYRAAVRTGMVATLAHLRPEADENLTKIALPAWAAERAAEIGAGHARNIAGLGIRIVGDLDSLAELPTQTQVTANPPPAVPSDLAAAAIVAAINGARAAGRREERAGGAAALDTAEGRATIELSPAATKVLRHALNRVRSVRYRASQLRRSATR